MSELTNSQQELYAGLQALVDSAFPKRCNVCGRVYETVDDFIRQTRMVRPDSTGLKQALDDDDEVVVELYRNCVCGSTLLDLFSDRRDTGSAGEQRRMYFSAMLEKLVETGYSMSVAHAELIKVMHGEDSEILHDHGYDPET
jgi:hypothetical protein